MLSKLPLMLVSDAGYGSQRGQNRRRHRCYDLHNPLKSFFLRHNRLIDLMVNRIYFTTEARSHRVFLNLCTEFSVSLSLCGFKISLLRPEWSSRQCQCCHRPGCCHQSASCRPDRQSPHCPRYLRCRSRSRASARCRPRRDK